MSKGKFNTGGKAGASKPNIIGQLGNARPYLPPPVDAAALKAKIKGMSGRLKMNATAVLKALQKMDEGATQMASMPEQIRVSIKGLKPSVKRFHGVKLSKYWFPPIFTRSKCRNRFGYMTSSRVRRSKLPFNPVNINLLNDLGALMGDPNRESRGTRNSQIPAGYTYFGQFVDHDVTLDVSSTLDKKMNANNVDNMRTPALDLDSLYGRGPALDPFLYVFPTSGPSTAIKFNLGSNRPSGPGGPGGTTGFGGMIVQKDFDVPRMSNPINPSSNTLTAIIGDPRNDENLIVSQFHHAMLKFHNEVVDLLAGSISGDIFVEAKKIVTWHYQWAVLHDFLTRVCGTTAINNALANVNAPINSGFRMPVEFSVAAYRFGHSMIRNQYWINFNFINQPLSDAFKFIRKPLIPVLSNWVVDFNSFFDTGISVPVNNKAKKIDSVLSNGLESLPGATGMMAILASRNLKRGLALGLPSGQATAQGFGITPMTTAQLTSGLPANEVALLNSKNKRLLKKTPLWYYILREAAVLENGEQLGPLGAKIVADTFVRMLKRDADSFLNASGGFSPFLAAPGTFTVADLVKFAGVTQP